MSKLVELAKEIFSKSKKHLIVSFIAVILATLYTIANPPEKATTKPSSVEIKEVYAFADLNITEKSKIVIYERPDGYKKITVQDGDTSKFVTLNKVAPSILNIWIQDSLLPKKIKYELKDVSEYPVLQAQAEENLKPKQSPVAVVVGVFKFIGIKLLENFYAVAMLIMMFILIKATTSGLNKKDYSVVLPDEIEGSWDELIGMEDIKKEVAGIIDVIENADAYEKNGIKKPFNIMFTGPAGTGKSKLAGYFAKKLGYPIVLAEGSSLENGFVGGGSRSLKAIYKTAKSLGDCVVFIDEAQSLFYKRGASQGPNQSKYADDTPNTFLSILDGVSTEQEGKIIWVVASNFDDTSMEMDEAMLRRFQLKVNFRLPNKEERKNILKKYFKVSKAADSNTALEAPENAAIEELSEITAELSPALLETIVTQSKMTAISEKSKITKEILFKSFERVVIGLTDRQTTAELHKTREIIAHHELGHFFVQLHFALEAQNGNIEKAFEELTTLKISTESVSKMNALGYVLSKQEEVKLLSRNSLEQRVVQLYGGVAAEEVIYGEQNITTGASDDIQKATNTLITMVSRLSMYSNKKLNYTELAKNSLETEKSISQVEAMAEKLYTKAVDIIKLHKNDIVALAPVLLDKFVMSKDEIKDAYLKLKLTTELTETQPD